MNDILFTPMKIGGCEIKNRIVMSPMLMGFGTFDGKPTEKLMNYYEERAKGGTGLIVTEITRVNDKTGAGAFAQLSMSTDENIEPMREFAKRIQRHGAKLFVQLHHPGRQNVGLLVGTVPLSIKMEKFTKGKYGEINLPPPWVRRFSETTLFPRRSLPQNAPPPISRAAGCARSNTARFSGLKRISLTPP